MIDTPGPDLAYQNYLAEGAFTVHVSGLTATVNGEKVVEGGVLVE